MKEENPGIKAMRLLSEMAKRNGTSEMTLEEINAEIEAVRKERLARKKSENIHD